MAGALALVIAGFGSAAFSSQTDNGALRADYQAISASYTGDTDPLTVSRSYDRVDDKRLKEQAEIQAAQKAKAQADTLARVEKAAEQIRANQWVVPVTGYNITARFGQRSSLWSTVHTGLDFAGPSGSTIVAVAAGTVTSTGYEGAYGNRTVVTLADGTEIWYCHQSRISVVTGQQVAAGEVIGYTGSTGNVTGPHLHLEIHPGGGDAVNPEGVLAEHGVTP